MKELSRKILESGLVDKHCALMLERWGQLEVGASELVGRQQLTKQTLEEFAEEIEQLIEQDDVIKETRLEAVDGMPRILLKKIGRSSIVFTGMVDEMGRYLVPPTVEFRRGDTLFVTPDESGVRFSYVGWVSILEIESLYEGEKAVAQQLTVQCVADPGDE